MNLAVNNIGDDTQGVIVGVDLEEPKNTDHPEDLENCGSCRKKEGKVVGQEGEKVNNAGKGKNIFQNGFRFRQPRESKIS